MLTLCIHPMTAETFVMSNADATIIYCSQ